ncbi:MAG: bifunctional (p)ppGpp synthetase/guanosine-3',5'-bis(diphosphate) 3'-pyrophosphohydrolase [Planctomycetaceae bacterium]|nr:bifunctional (p)ppGpp synthetase/guanosine-3',5'-bis(diphosphate) 3'-pyrophosphohydrolase [Planctomycetaceae bacterium]
MSAASDGMLLERALRLAAVAHRQQVRKCSDVPYFAHCAAVALILAQFGFDDEELLAAAALHDVVEDTDVTLAQLAVQFPPTVIEAVAALSETKNDADGKLRPWEDRKAEHLRHIASASLSARAIALADKLHNMLSMRLDLAAGTLSLGAFRAPPERLLWYYRSMIDAAAGDDAQLAPLAQACYAVWEQLRAELRVLMD